MRINFKRCFAVVSGVALFASFGFVYSSIARAEGTARVTAIVICYGAPQEHAEVTIGDRSEETKKNGACVFDVQPGSYTATANSHGGHGFPKGNKSVNVNLKPGEITQIVFEVCQPEKWPQIFPYGGPSDVQK